MLRSASDRLPLLALLGVFMALAFAMSVIVPLGEASDEVSHWAYVQYLCKHQALPAPEGEVLGESRQPPLFYIFSAAATCWVPRTDWAVIANPDFSLGDSSTPNLLLHLRRESWPFEGEALAWHLARVLSVLMGVMTVWATYGIARAIVPGDNWFALSAGAFVAFLPGFLFLSSEVNNDNLVIALTTLGVLLIFRLASGTPRARDATLLGLVLGLALLAKWSGLVLWLFAPIALSIVALRDRRWVSVLLCMLISYCIALVIAIPWTLHNLVTFGDPLGWSLALTVTDLRLKPMQWQDWFHLAKGLYTSYWGRFGGMLNLRMPAEIYVLLGVGQAITLLGWIGHLRDMAIPKASSGIVYLSLTFPIFSVILVASFVRWSITFAGTDQARLLFPGLALLACSSMAGLGRLFLEKRQVAVSAWIGIFLLLDLFVLRFLYVTYNPLPLNASALPPLSGTKAPADFGHSIRMIDYRVSPTEVVPGSSVQVQFQWEALQDLEENYWLLLKVEGQSGTLVEKEGTPSDGRVSTDRWERGDIYSSTHALEIPEDAPPGIFRLTVGLHPFGQWDWLSVRAQDTLELGAINVVR